MAETRVQQAAAPDIDREDVHTVFMSHWHVASEDRGRAVLDEIADAWEGTSRPADVLSFSCYLSTGSDHFTVMTYAQCTRPDGYRPFIRSLPAQAARVEPVEYRLHRSVLLAPETGPAARSSSPASTSTVGSARSTSSPPSRRTSRSRRAPTRAG